jgi:hypothetical protein
VIKTKYYLIRYGLALPSIAIQEATGLNFAPPSGPKLIEHRIHDLHQVIGVKNLDQPLWIKLSAADLKITLFEFKLVS